MLSEKELNILDFIIENDGKCGDIQCYDCPLDFNGCVCPSQEPDELEDTYTAALTMKGRNMTEINEEFDVVQRPAHYNQGGVECIEAIKAALTPEEYRGYLKGNGLKYIWRELHKHGTEDIRKCIYYLQKLVEFSKGVPDGQ